jgi:serine/threonine protein kinase
MAIEPGTKLGPYEIMSALGAGGMGEVYRATDTRLGRTVAIKVLPSHLSENEQFRQRFEREAKTISQLSHPYICTLYDIGRENGINFIVMEYLEGETLAQKLLKGPLTTLQVLQYGIQIADALDKAHKQGIVHRDLKPGNIMLTKGGAKLLDFGLAKLQASGSQQMMSGVSVLPTEMQQNLTAEGTIVGTFQYMAPEQLEGKDADSRTDIFGFGAVMYEMITGRKAFTGKSQASLIAAILERDPQPMSELQPVTPPALERTVRTCLAKDPDDRWQTAHDVMLQLKWISDGTLSAPTPAVTPGSQRQRSLLPWFIAATALVIAAVALTYIYGRGTGQADLPQFRLEVNAPDNVRLQISKGFALSPDGRYLVFVGESEAARQLWLRPLAETSAKRLDGTDDASFPFWSPDSRFVGFFANGKLKKISIPEGITQVICDASIGRGGAWNQEGTILFTHSQTHILYRVDSKGGSPEPVTSPNQPRVCRWPVFLPDGRRFLFEGWDQLLFNRSIFAGSLDSSEIKKVIDVDSMAMFDPKGYLLYVYQKTLMARAFDVRKCEVAGEPFSLVRGVGVFRQTGPTGYAPFSVSGTGVLAQGSIDESRRIMWLDRTGKALEMLGSPGGYAEPYFSPDEKQIVLDNVNPQGSMDLWTIDLSKKITSRFTFMDSPNTGGPVWSPDGKSIAFYNVMKDHLQIFLKPASGSTKEQLVLGGEESQWPDDWSKDGRFLLFVRHASDKSTDLWVLPMTGERKPFPYLQSPANEAHSQFSPDGNWVAYASDETGRPEIYVQGFPDPASGRFQISTSGGDTPMWRRDGKELYYLEPNGNLMAVPVQNGSQFVPGSPHILFKTEIEVASITDYRNMYVPSGDGKRFLVIQPEAMSQPLFITTNWRADQPNSRKGPAE